ncbi:hypothetical protein [Streptomyces sp. SCSIO ZS0520]|uniref:hypothetical protein n=1 Tax=Streptomyces sp. SCSIO ZS0520 TaxID=2892996 RepID=UPI0021DA7E1C|nr:hypothetical protein [Streptomyces sp. SCSIO ZS0520]
MGAYGYRSTGAAVASVSLGLVLALAGCGGEDEADGAARGSAPSTAEKRATPSKTPARKPSPSASPTAKPSPTGTSAADGTDVGACYDGRCEIAVSEPTEIALDGRFEIADFSIARVTSSSVIVEGTGRGGTFMQTQVGAGGTGGLNGLGFRVKSLAKGTAVLAFFPEK